MIAAAKTIAKNTIVEGFRRVQHLVDAIAPDDTICLVSKRLTSGDLHDIRARLDFYVPGRRLSAHDRWPLVVALSSRAVLTSGEHNAAFRRFSYYRGGVFDVDQVRNHLAAWAWCYLAEYCTGDDAGVRASRQRLCAHIESLRAQHLGKVYVFGTGPSLSQAARMDWSDGYRIVCNTIVRDAQLWQTLDPHFIVAGDALYHFSYTKFARAFRKDLAARLSETNTYFVYPALFNSIVIREMHEYADRLIPVPDGTHVKINADLRQEFSLPNLDNVLPYLLLPLGCTLSRKVFLWGFDGRGPTDQLFWTNSAGHTYSELLSELRAHFPAFFDHFVPANDPSQYVEDVHGDVLERCLQAAENEGWCFEMMHRSWTPTLDNRYRVSI
jgi:hypothetical protein